MAEMIDPFGRAITYLRVSVTDRCDFRCNYCMAEDMTFLPKQEILSLEELDRVCSAFVRQGVKKLRMTGGEPLVRRDIMKLFRSLSRWTSRWTGSKALCRRGSQDGLTSGAGPSSTGSSVKQPPGYAP
jgi:cyclic pyranopterin phosphate synthase